MKACAPKSVMHIGLSEVLKATTENLTTDGVFPLILFLVLRDDPLKDGGLDGLGGLGFFGGAGGGLCFFEKDSDNPSPFGNAATVGYWFNSPEVVSLDTNAFSLSLNSANENVFTDTEVSAGVGSISSLSNFIKAVLLPS